MSIPPELRDIHRAVHRLRERLATGAAELPGRTAHRLMAVDDRPLPDLERTPHHGSRQGAALALIYPLGDRPHVVLTERSRALSNHAGQISLPGGRLDEGEDHPRAALREAWEELQVQPDGVEVLGRLSPLWIPPSDFVVHPVVGFTGARPMFRPNPAEVARVIEAPLSNLADPAAHRVLDELLEGRSRRVPYIDVRGHRVWGATAMILSELLAVLIDGPSRHGEAVERHDV